MATDGLAGILEDSLADLSRSTFMAMCVGTIVESTWMTQLLVAPRPPTIFSSFGRSSRRHDGHLDDVLGGAWSGLERNALVGAVNAAPSRRRDRREIEGPDAEDTVVGLSRSCWRLDSRRASDGTRGGSSDENVKPVKGRSGERRSTRRLRQGRVHGQSRCRPGL